MDHVKAIECLIAPSLVARGYTLVRLRLTGARRRTLQLMAERSDGDGMTVDDCAEISRAISVLLDTKDPIEGTYDLEISSPGIDRPLVKTEDFSRYVGFEVDVWMKKPLNGRRKFSGRLVKVSHTNVSIEVGPLGENMNMPLSHIGDAKLALTEDLVLAARSDTDNE